MSFSGLSLKSVMADVVADAAKYDDVVRDCFDEAEGLTLATPAAKIETIYGACVAEIQDAGDEVEHLKLWTAIAVELGVRATAEIEPVGNQGANAT